MSELDNPVMEPSDKFYGKSEADNVETPVEEVAEVSQETPEETVVESEELEAKQEVKEDGDEAPVYQIGEHEITESRLNDLQKAYDDRESMRADYSRKTAGAADKIKAETSKQVAEKLGDIDAKANTLVEHATALEALLTEMEGNVNLEELREDDYEEYQKTKETIENRRTKLKEATETAHKAVQEANTVRLAEEQRLFIGSNPEWSDDKGLPTVKRDEDFKAINDYAQAVGFTEQEFAQLQSHRVLLAMLDAAKYRQLKEKTTASKKVKVAPKLVKPTQSKSTKTDDTLSAGDRFYAKG